MAFVFTFASQKFQKIRRAIRESRGKERARWERLPYRRAMIEKLLRQILLLIEPIGFVWLCLLLSTALLWRKRERKLASATLALAAFVFVVGSTGLAGSLLGSLERPFAAVKVGELPPGDAVVLLGGGTEPSRYEANGIHFTPAGDRLNMALEMMRLRKAPALVLGGGGSDFDGDFLSESQIVAHWFEGLQHAGVFDAGAQIIPLPPCLDTHDEAAGVRKLATQRGWRRILLVTSANHMRRAAALFRTQGLEVAPVPCNFLTTISTAPSAQGMSAPNCDGFEKIAIWMHEEVGWWEYRRRGWIAPGATK
jgi:uncharacterized SAM-binding protein YcdF (DUF218 family)